GHRDTIDGPGPSRCTSRFTSPRRSSSASASARVATSSATKSREAESEISVILLQAPNTLLALQQRFDGSDRGLDTVHRQVVGDVLRDGGAPEGGGVLACAPVLRGVDDERDLTALHQIDGVRPKALENFVDDFRLHPVTLEHTRGALRRDEREAHLDQPPGQAHHDTLVAILPGDEDLAGS